MTPPTPLPAAFDDTGYQFRHVPFAIVAVLALLVGLAPLPLAPDAHRTLVVLVAAAGLWVTEALPVAVVALLVPVLGTALGVTGARQAFAPFGDPIVFLFFGTFLLTDAAATHGLNARLARAVLSQPGVQRRPTRLLWAVAMLGGGLSAFMNNTATAALLIPLALTAQHFASRRFLSSVLLAASYAPSLGGLATPVGTAPNLIGLRLLEEVTGHRPSFAAWCVAFAPLAIAATIMATLWLRARSGAGRGLPPLPDGLIEPLNRPWSRAERTLLPLYIGIVLLWIGPGLMSGIGFGYVPWVEIWQARLPESVVPLLGGLVLFALPSGDGDKRILDAGVFRRLDWSTILLFGGGLSLGSMMFDSGLARALGEALFHMLPTPGLFGVVLASTVMAVAMSEMTSNTASAALVVPVVLALAQAAGVDPVKPALAATLGCSFGFMLPISTPPNALVYATGRVRMGTMIRNGMVLDVLGVLLVAMWVTFVY
jgi:sodium-dependent dicarboxylate transporter 2/3/5